MNTSRYKMRMMRGRLAISNAWMELEQAVAEGGRDTPTQLPKIVSALNKLVEATDKIYIKSLKLK